MKTAPRAVEDEDMVIEGGGNVFADLGLPDAARRERWAMSNVFA